MDTTRQARQSSGPTPYTVGDTYFLGMDTRQDAERLDPGIMQSIQNMLPSGNGSLTSRAGFQGMLTTAHAGSVYSMTRWVSSGGTVYFVYAAVGKLWRVTKDGTSATEIKKTGAVSFAFTNNGRGVMMRRRGAYIYLIDSEDSSGSLYRLDMAGIIAGTSEATAVSGLTAPITAPTATKYDDAPVIRLGTSYGTWSQFSPTTTNLIDNPNFDGGGAGGDVGTYWKEYGSPKCYTNATVSSLPVLSGTYTWLRVDNHADRVLATGTSGSTSLSVTNAYYSNASWTSPTKIYATRFLIDFNLITIGTGNKPVWVKMQFFSSDPTGTYDIDKPMFEVNRSYFPSVAYKAERMRESIDVSDYINSGDPKFIRIYIIADIDQPTGASTNYVTDFNVYPTPPTLAQPSTALTTDAMFFYPDSSMMDGNLKQWKGIFSYTSTDLTAYDQLSLLSEIKGQWTNYPMFRIGFTNGSDYWYSAEYEFAPSVTIDIASCPTSIKSASNCFYFEFTTDGVIVAPPVTRAVTTDGPLRFKTISTPGNLTDGASYTYLYSFVDANGTTYDDGGIESSGSPLSATIDMTGGATRVKLTIPRSGYTQTYPSGTDYIAIWRLGGTMPDGDTRARLVAFVPTGADATYPASTTISSPTNKWYWDYNTATETSTFYDNVPDADIVNEASYQAGRDLPITGATALAVHGDRIVLGKGGYVYFSWLIGDSESNGLYFTYNPDPSDPEVSVKGALLRVVGTGDSNKIVALQPLLLNRGDLIGNALAVLLSETPPSIITGYTGDITSADAFSVRPFPQEVGGGCLSWRSVLEAEGGVWYAAASGIVSATNVNITRKSLSLEGTLSLFSAGTSNYSQVAMLLHDERVWVFLPTVGGTTGSVYVLDNRIPADKGWVTLTGSIGFTGGLSLSGGGDTGDLYLAGMDGQIYKYTGTSDKATPSGSATAIALSVKSRRHGQSSAQGMGVLGVSRPFQISFESTVGATTAWTVTLENEYGQTQAKTWNITSTGRQEKTTVRGWRDLRGKVHSARFQASVTTQTVLRDYLLFMTEGGEVR